MGLRELAVFHGLVEAGFGFLQPIRLHGLAVLVEHGLDVGGVQVEFLCERLDERGHAAVARMGVGGRLGQRDASAREADGADRGDEEPFRLIHILKEDDE